MINPPTISRIRATVLAVALSVSGTIPRSRGTETFNREYAFRIVGDLKTAMSIRELLININRGVDRYLGKPDNSRRLPTLNAYTSTNDLPPTSNTRSRYIARKDGYHIAVPPESGFTQTVARLTHLAFLQRMTVALPGNRVKASEPPAWMVAAVAAPLIAPHQATTDSLELSPRALVPVQTRFNAPKSAPELNVLVDRPAQAAFPNAYTLYSLHAHMLAELILNLNSHATEKPINRLFRLHAQGRNPASSMRLVIEPLLPPGTSLQQWFASAAIDYLNKKNERTTGAQVADEIAFLLTVDVDDLPADTLETVTRRVPITAIPDESEFWGRSNPLLARRLNQFIRLLTRSPKSFRDPVTRYLEAFQELVVGNGDIRQFKRRITRTDAEFAATFARHRRISDYLAAYELQMGSGIRGLDRFMAVVANHKLRLSNLAPRLTRYLDQVESEIE